MLPDRIALATADLQRCIHDRYALHFTGSRVRTLESLLQQRCRSPGHASVSEYCKLLVIDRTLLGDLVDELTTKETYFFRIPKHFAALRHHVLPELEERLAQRLRFDPAGNPSESTLRLWSAACSTGQEAYSLQIALREGLRYPRAWKQELWATDISRRALKTAALGQYPSARIDSDLRARLAPYLQSANGTLRISSDLRRGMRFGRFNLRKLTLSLPAATLEELSGGTVSLPLENHFDIIFCRNVLIYFDLEDQQQMVSGLERALKPGGYLFTGDAEPLHIYDHGLELHRHDGAIYYRRPRQP